MTVHEDAGRKLRGLLCLLCLFAAISCPASALEELEAEQNIADLLPSQFPGEGRVHDVKSRRWAVLPQIGYAPDTGPLGGIKYSHRDISDTGTSLDVDAVYALNEQQVIKLGLASPLLKDGRWRVLLRARYLFDPRRDFFGLGNNELLDCDDDFDPELCHCSPDDPLYPDCPQGGPYSTHEFQDLGGAVTVSWRPFERVSFNVGTGLRKVDIRDGKRLDEVAFTPVKFADLSGIEGGVVNPVAVSLVWNTRDDVMRPTRGWRIILKIIHANQAFSDFKFTRYIADGGYLRSLADGRYIFGVRANGEWVDSRKDQIPFWELSELGGEDTLRGFFPHRFVGKGRVLLNGEFRFRVSEFNFFDFWYVKIDGVLFGDGGRVFIKGEELRDEFNVDSEVFERVINNFQYSYGTGLRIALSEALIARIDAGFSEEEIGLLYLSFGHTF